MLSAIGIKKSLSLGLVAVILLLVAGATPAHSRGLENPGRGKPRPQGLGCYSVKVVPGQTVTCTFSATNATAFDLSAVLSQLAQYGVSDTDVFWLEAWGGSGSHGNTDNGGSGGAGGYAQTTSTVSAFEDAWGTSLFYYYTGLSGRFEHDSGGDGGTATIVTVNDLSKTPPTQGQTVLVAAGGGGGGAGRGKAVCTIPFRLGSFTVLGGGGGAGGRDTHPRIGFANGVTLANLSGGGGGSVSARSAFRCNAAPQTAPPNPNGETGFVQITFDIGACDGNADRPNDHY